MEKNKQTKSLNKRETQSIITQVLPLILFQYSLPISSYVHSSPPPVHHSFSLHILWCISSISVLYLCLSVGSYLFIPVCLVQNKHQQQRLKRYSWYHSSPKSLKTLLTLYKATLNITLLSEDLSCYYFIHSPSLPSLLCNQENTQREGQKCSNYPSWYKPLSLANHLQ